MPHLPDQLLDANPLDFVHIALVGGAILFALIVSVVKKLTEAGKSKPSQSSRAARVGNPPSLGQRRSAVSGAARPAAARVAIPRQRAAARPASTQRRVAVATRQIAPPPVPLRPVATTIIPAASIAKSPPTRSPARPTTSLNAAAIRRWLRPQTLNRQFIVTEIFQDAPSIREGENQT